VTYGTQNGLLIIQDDDVIFGFSQTNYTVRESAGFIAIPVTRFGDTGVAVRKTSAKTKTKTQNQI